MSELKWTRQELLDVLDMSKDQQISYLEQQGVLERPTAETVGTCLVASLADVAFRLRNELHYAFGSMAWDLACWKVWVHIKKRQESNIFERKHLSLDSRQKYCYSWTAFWAEPIDLIIISLLAKVLLNDNEKWDDEAENIGLDVPRFTRKGTLMYAIAQGNGMCGFGFWDGPNPSLEEMLEVDGRDKNSVIIRFNPDGTNEIIYEWCCGEWMKVIHIVEGELS